MVETLFILLTAHLLGDFVLQRDWMVKYKRDPRVLFIHAGQVTAVSALLLGTLDVPLLLILLVSHMVIDGLKVHAFRDDAYAFMGDQVLHIVAILGLAALFPATARDGLWLTLLPPEGEKWFVQGVTLLGGVLLCVPAGGVLIGIMIRPLLEEIGKDKQADRHDGAGYDVEGLRRGGRYIGWLERSLVMLLLLIGQPGGIGFLVAAKSILRFGEIKDSHQRKMAEYIIIGTFLSFGWALLTSYLTQRALTLW
jgi:hypothetical protein